MVKWVINRKQICQEQQMSSLFYRYPKSTIPNKNDIIHKQFTKLIQTKLEEEISLTMHSNQNIHSQSSDLNSSKSKPIQNISSKYTNQIPKYHFFPHLNKYYFNTHKNDYSLNQLIHNNTTQHFHNQIQITLDLSKITTVNNSNSDCCFFTETQNQNNKPITHKQLLINFSKCSKNVLRVKKQTSNLKQKKKSLQHKHKHLVAFQKFQTPPLGFYNLSSLEDFKYKKIKTPIISLSENSQKQQKNQILQRKSKEKKIIKSKRGSENIYKDINKNIINQIVPSLHHKQKSLKFIDTFYEGHKKFQTIFSNIKKKIRH